MTKKIIQLGKNMDTNEPWLSLLQITLYLGVSKESVYRWLKKGIIPAYRVGKQWRFKASEIDQWVKLDEVTGTTE